MGRERCKCLEQFFPVVDRVHAHEAMQGRWAPAGVGLSHDGPAQFGVASQAHLDPAGPAHLGFVSLATDGGRGGSWQLAAGKSCLDLRQCIRQRLRESLDPGALAIDGDG